MLSPLSHYLHELHEIRATGAAVKETSYYPPLVELLNGVGTSLKPKVRCHSHVSNTGAGIPDAGLFTSEQFPPQDKESPLPNARPERGVLEVKGTGEDVAKVAQSEQVAKYVAHYGLVLVTNYRSFLIVERGAHSTLVLGERFDLTESEAAFWSLAGQAALVPEALAVRFEEYLRRALSIKITLTQPQEVAWWLASYARDAKLRIESGDASGLAPLKKTLQETLGIAFEGEKGEHFFRSTLVQTLFYGIFSAWVLWHREQGASGTGSFDWRTAVYLLKVPVIRDLFYTVANPQHLDALGISEVLARAGAVLNRVERTEFFERFEAENAVQYFYEPFLNAFDPELRRELGVWYTPREIVRYQVARVDSVLKSELGIARGLADERVFVLDPCCGTGAYLVEVVKYLHASLGDDALAAAELKQSVLSRLFGFEILPAPFVVAHLQLGLLLSSLGVGLSPTSKERMGVYLTNALTGWEPGGVHPALTIAGFAEERDAAEKVKQKTPILVILGNPPYNGYAGMAVEEERSLSNAYRTVKAVPAPQGQGLNDLYVRFFRMAEKRIVETGGQGVVCYISNYSWLEGLSFTGMRERYAEVFDTIWIDNCNGDKYKTGKLTPEGLPDPSVFSTEFNKEGIQVGTAIALLVRRKDGPAVVSAGTHHATLHYRDFWGKAKRQEIEAAQDGVSGPAYQEVQPEPKLSLPFAPLVSSAGYLEWKKLPELFPTSFPGVKTSRDDVVVGIDLTRLQARMEAYFDPAIPDDTIRTLTPGAMEKSGGFDAVGTRQQLQKIGLKPENFVRYCYRPFDIRWLYWESQTKLLDRSRPEYWPHVGGNPFLFATSQTRKSIVEPPGISELLTDLNFQDSGARGIPLRLRATDLEEDRLDDGTRYNLSDFARDYLQQLNAAPDDLFYHALAILHAPTYREENAGALRQDWPRVPLPTSAEALAQSAALGRQVAALLDPEQSVSGVTQAPLHPELIALAVISATDGGALNPDQGDLALTAGWGHGTSVVMPGKGRVVTHTDSETGRKTHDIYLNSRAYWRNVPEEVWAYTLGGYTVLKKWLSYREQAVLGRSLTIEEARYFSQTVRRIAALLALSDTLTGNYRATNPPSPARRRGLREFRIVPPSDGG